MSLPGVTFRAEESSVTNSLVANFWLSSYCTGRRGNAMHVEVCNWVQYFTNNP